jgi:serine/threonine-protein kinase
VLGSVIGLGNATVVHRGVLETLGARRAVAIKIWDGPTSPRLVSSLERSTCIVHRNVVATYDFAFPDDASPFFVTELVDGVTLEKRLADPSAPPLALDEIVAIVSRVAEALAAAWFGAHPDGTPLQLAHGSVCSRDVFVTSRGEVKLEGFGQSSPYAELSGIRDIDARSPRVAALAPEVANGAAPDARSDVYALGAMLRAMLPPIGAPKLLLEVAFGALAEDPSKRFLNARAFSTALARVAKALDL